MKLKITFFILTILLSTKCPYNFGNTTINKQENSQTKLETVPIEKFYEMVKNSKNNPNFVIIDFRTEEEYRSGYIEGAVNINFYATNLKEILQNLDKEKIYLIYCRSGNRSGKALNIMKDLGFKEVYNCEGGILQWKAKNYPLISF